MKRTHRNLLLTIPLLLLALIACDFASKFVPPIEVGNVFGIGTPEAPTTLKAPAFQDPNDLGAFLPAAVGAIDYEATNLTFPNVELPNMYGFTLDGLWVTIGLGDTITLERESPHATYPTTFTLTGIEAFINVSDNQSIRKPVDYHFKERDLAITYERQGTCATDSCTYKATATTNDLQNAMLFEIPESDGTTVKDLIAIASEGGQNHARIKARLTADAPSGSLEGLAPTFQIMNTSTKVSLGG